MPEIFKADCKFTLIEYGSQQQGLETVGEMKDKITSLLSSMISK